MPPNLQSQLLKKRRKTRPQNRRKMPQQKRRIQSIILVSMLETEFGNRLWAAVKEGPMLKTMWIGASSE